METTKEDSQPTSGVCRSQTSQFNHYFLQCAMQNMFDNLAALAPPTQADLRDELDRYLSTDVEAVEDVIRWWVEHRGKYPRLSRMALDYLTIPGMYHILLSQFSSNDTTSHVCGSRTCFQSRPTSPLACSQPNVCADNSRPPLSWEMESYGICTRR